MRFNAVPDFDHGELGWVIVGLVKCDGLTSLRGFDHGHNGEEKVAQGFCRFGFGLEFADAGDGHMTPFFLWG